MEPDVERWVERLQSPDALRRAEAARALGRLGDDAAMPFLLEALCDPERKVSDAIAEAVGRLLARSDPDLQAALEDADAFSFERAPDTLPGIVPACAPALLDAMVHKDGFVRHCVVEALGRIGPSVAPALREMLQSSDGFVRGEAAAALGRIGDPTAIPFLLDLLKDKNTFACQYAANALGHYGAIVIPALVERLRDPDAMEGAVEALGRVGEASATPALLEAMQRRGLVSTADYLLAFQRIGSGARPYLHEALQDPYEFTRANAARALGGVGGDRDVPVLLEALQDSGSYGHARSSAAYALGNIGDRTAVPALLAALHDKFESVRSAAAALGRFDEEGVIPGLIQALADRSLKVRNRATDTLAAKDSAALPALERALFDANEAIQVGCATALLRIREDQDLPRRLLLLPDVAPQSRAAAFLALEKAHHPFPPPDVLCRDLMGDQNPVVRLAAAQALGALRTCSGK